MAHNDNNLGLRLKLGREPENLQYAVRNSPGPVAYDYLSIISSIDSSFFAAGALVGREPRPPMSPSRRLRFPAFEAYGIAASLASTPLLTICSITPSNVCMPSCSPC